MENQVREQKIPYVGVSNLNPGACMQPYLGNFVFLGIITPFSCLPIDHLRYFRISWPSKNGLTMVVQGFFLGQKEAQRDPTDPKWV